MPGWVKRLSKKNVIIFLFSRGLFFTFFGGSWKTPLVLNKCSMLSGKSCTVCVLIRKYPCMCGVLSAFRAPIKPDVVKFL